MSERELRRLRYTRLREVAMSGQQHQNVPGATDPQVQMLVTAFAAALAQVPALQQPQQPAQASASVTPAVAPQLPTNVIKLPTFY
jgi:hypothetical protein